MPRVSASKPTSTAKSSSRPPRGCFANGAARHQCRRRHGAAGLTHGGFYGHFESKEALAQEASGRAFEQSADRWQDRNTAHEDDKDAARRR